MTKLSLHNDFHIDHTLVSHIFIDHYMADANGEFVKIYIYLLRHVQNGSELAGLSAIADAMTCTENDVLRALLYWEKKALLSLTHNDGILTGITLCTPKLPTDAKISSETKPIISSESSPEAMNAYATSDVSVKEETDQLPTIEQASITNEKRRELISSNEEVKQIVYFSNKFIGKPLTATELNRILFFYDELHFSVELIEYLIEYCVSKNKRSMHYISKVGLGWYESGVRTVADAKAQTNIWRKEYYTILRAFGINGVNPVKRQVDFMKRWLDEYGFSLELICEACDRTVAKTGQPSFEYAEGILSSWHNSHVITMDDVKNLDQKYQDQKQQKSQDTASARPNSSGQKGTANDHQKRTTNRFNNFHQRDYNYQQLEKELLQKQLAKKNDQ